MKLAEMIRLLDSDQAPADPTLAHRQRLWKTLDRATPEARPLHVALGRVAVLLAPPRTHPRTEGDRLQDWAIEWIADPSIGLPDWLRESLGMEEGLEGAGLESETLRHVLTVFIEEGRIAARIAGVPLKFTEGELLETLSVIDFIDACRAA